MPGLEGSGTAEIKELAAKLNTASWEERSKLLRSLSRPETAAVLSAVDPEVRKSALDAMRKEERTEVVDLLTRALTSNQRLIERADWAQDPGAAQHRYMVAQEAVDAVGPRALYHSRHIHLTLTLILIQQRTHREPSPSS